MTAKIMSIYSIEVFSETENGGIGAISSVGTAFAALIVFLYFYEVFYTSL